MSDLSPLWCAADEPHPAHEERNEFGGTNYCSGRPAADDDASRADAYRRFLDALGVDDGTPAHRAAFDVAWDAGRASAGADA